MAEYDEPLRLVTPSMRDKKGETRVRDAQFLLGGGSRFKDLAPYKDGPQDAVYGPMTARATERAKYWLGFPDSGVDQVFGQTVYEYLRPKGWRPLPKAYRDRRNERMKTVAPGVKALAEARRHLGYSETPVNRTKFGEWYGWNGVAWCAIFVSYCFAASGWPTRKFHYASVEMIYRNAAAQRDGMRIVTSPQPGDICLYQFAGEPWAHTAFFVRWVRKGETFRDLGGNTDAKDFANGGGVAEQTRAVDLVHAFVRVG